MKSTTGSHRTQKIEVESSPDEIDAHPEWELIHSWHLATIDAFLYCSVELRRDSRPYARQSRTIGQRIKWLSWIYESLRSEMCWGNACLREGYIC